MAEVSSLKACFQGLTCPKIRVIQVKRLPSGIKCCKGSFFKHHNGIQVTSAIIETGKIHLCKRNSHPSHVGRNPQCPSIEEDFAPEPFWSNLLKEAFWAVKSLLGFLVEQPSQLKYIEWPGLQSTLKTATLTLLLVGLLIISLTSVDSALYYILAVVLRRRA